MKTQQKFIAVVLFFIDSGIDTFQIMYTLPFKSQSVKLFKKEKKKFSRDALN